MEATTTAADIRGDTPNSYLTLSALTGLLPEDARTAAAIERDLDAIAAARAAGEAAAADALTDALIGRVFWPELDAGLGPDVSETELRLLWGDR